MYDHNIFSSASFSIRTESVFSARVRKNSGVHSAGVQKQHWSSALTSNKFILNSMRTEVVTYLFKTEELSQLTLTKRDEKFNTIVTEKAMKKACV